MTQVQIQLLNRDVHTINDDRDRGTVLSEMRAILQQRGVFEVHQVPAVSVLQKVDRRGLGTRVAGLRRARKLSQVQLAQRVKRSESWLSQVERGERKLDRLSVLESLAEALDVRVGDLTGVDMPTDGTSDEYILIPSESVYLLRVI